MVAYAIEHQKALDDFTIEEFKSFSDVIEPDIYHAIDVKVCVTERKVKGAPGDVSAALKEAERYLNHIVAGKKSM